MNESPLHNLYLTQQVREIDRAGMREGGILPRELMQRAGQAAFDLIRKHYPDARRWLIVCGPGNNGGDGYVVGGLAAAAGLTVEVVQNPGPPKKPPADAFNPSAWQAWDEARRLVFDMHAWDGAPLNAADVVVDALLGSGLSRPVAGRFQSLIEAMNAHRAPVVALDVPSGLDTDTGMPVPLAVRAQSSLCFIALKRGLLTGAAADFVGDLYLATLGVPMRCFEKHQPSARIIDAQALRARLGKRRPGAHKGEFGHVLLLGGNQGMGGAVALAAIACLRSGAGLVTALTHPAHAAALLATRPEVMWVGLQEQTDVCSLLARASVVALGPGLGRDRWAVDAAAMLYDCDLPMVLDADGLSLLLVGRSRKAPLVITPHPGEAAGLLSKSTAEVMQDRFASVLELANRFQCVCVLKGSGTLVSDGDTTNLCDRGNPGMASAGMGDALTGIVAALLAQGLTATDAACYGVALHASAGDLAAGNGERGLLASDLMGPVRRLANALDPFPPGRVEAWPGS